MSCVHILNREFCGRSATKKPREIPRPESLWSRVRAEERRAKIFCACVAFIALALCIMQFVALSSHD